VDDADAERRVLVEHEQVGIVQSHARVSASDGSAMLAFIDMHAETVIGRGHTHRG
jgi:hypothetical protein